MEITPILIQYSFGVALVASIIGFIRTVYFISLGYTLSIIAMSVLFASQYGGEFSIYHWLQVILLAIWGIRLGSFLVKRELNSNYKNAVKDQTNSSQEQPIGIKFAIWIGVSILYVCMFSPALFTLQGASQSGGINQWIAFIGVLIMAGGLVIESIADRQKSKFKRTHPKEHCTIGLYQWVRCPNYFGEILVWTGNLIVAIGFMNAWWQWALALVGWICIVLIMMGSTKRLEKKQREKYGADDGFQQYIKTVPVLFPGVPLYSLEKIKVYLE